MRKLSLGLATLLSWALLPTSSEAAPFEVITAGDVEIRMGGGTVLSFTAWAWITPQAGHTLNDLEIESAVLTTTFSTPDVLTSTSSLSTPDTFTLTAGEFAGNRVDNSNTYNAIYDTSFDPGDSRPYRLFTPIRFETPFDNYTGSGVLDGRIEIGSDVATFSINVDFLNSGRVFEAQSSQRVASVPEPGTAALVGLGLVGLAARRRD